MTARKREETLQEVPVAVTAFTAESLDRLNVEDLGDLDEMFAKGEFAPLLAWLRKNVHTHGKRHAPRELVRRVTGAAPSAEPLLRHLRAKARDLYAVN